MEVDSGSGSQFTTKCFDVAGTLFECPARYTLRRPIGKGAYGVVCSAVDNFTGEEVAIKKISGIVDSVTDCRRTLREMRLLRHFKHENVISIRDVYVPAGDGPNFKDVYTVSELMATDLHNIIASNQGLTEEHCQYFTYQILKALKHIHSANVLHRDLKPSNILLNGNCDLKICDFGLARVNPEEASQLTAYVATRWYRAPEIMLCWREYTRAVDMWSVGCILAEIVGRRPLFPGTDFLHQLQLVTDVIGTPSHSDIEAIKNENAGNMCAPICCTSRESVCRIYFRALIRCWGTCWRRCLSLTRRNELPWRRRWSIRTSRPCMTRMMSPLGRRLLI